MKIYISIDMEGLWGITSKEQIHQDGKFYQHGRQLMVEELNIVLEILFDLGVSEVLVNDAHGTMDNICVEKMHPKASLITGSHKPLSMMEGIAARFNGVIFIGYHPRANTNNGIFDHTYAGKIVESVYVNGELLGEGGLNARLAGVFDVPVIFASGDDVFTQQVKAEIGNIPTLAVKHTLSRYAAKHLSKASLKSQYKEKLSSAFKNLNKNVVKTSTPILADLTFKENAMCLNALLLEDVTQTDTKTVTFETRDYLTFYKKFRALIKLAQ